MAKITRGTQVAYVPQHADGNLEHPDVEFGFVTARGDIVAIVRFWSKANPLELRTKANGESTRISDLVVHSIHPQWRIDEYLQIY